VFRAWRMAPWIRAPVLLVRRSGVATPLIAASFVATLPAAAAAPFLSSSTNATLHRQIRRSCPSNVGDLITYDLHTYSPDDFTSPWPLVDKPPSVPEALNGDEAIEQRIASVAASSGGLAAPVIAWHATNAKVQVGARAAAVTSMTIPDFADHVHVVSGPNGDGVWIPDGFASAYHLAVGEPLVYQSDYGPPTKVRIAAIYRDIRSEPLNPAFCAMQLLIFGPRGALLFGDDTQNAIPPVILMDRKTFATGVIPYRGKGAMMFPLRRGARTGPPSRVRDRAPDGPAVAHPPRSAAGGAGPATHGRSRHRARDRGRSHVRVVGEFRCGPVLATEDPHHAAVRGDHRHRCRSRRGISALVRLRPAARRAGEPGGSPP
jgi:hypothetical protein